MKSKKFYVVNALDAFNKGWLSVNLNRGDSVVIPCGTSLELNGDTYTITNGFYKGESLRSNYQSFHFLNSLKSELPKVKVINKIYLNQRNRTITTNLGITYSLVDSFLPIFQKGTYTIECPKYPHIKKTKRAYLNEKLEGSRFAETWFEITHPFLKEGYYLHLGRVSEGCLTVSIKNNTWNKIYTGLIFNQYSDQKIADLEVL